MELLTLADVLAIHNEVQELRADLDVLVLRQSLRLLPVAEGLRELRFEPVGRKRVDHLRARKGGGELL